MTKEAIDLRLENAPCDMLRHTIRGTCCSALESTHKGCGSHKCPFYKPEGCSDWVRIGYYLYPPESVKWVSYEEKMERRAWTNERG